MAPHRVPDKEMATLAARCALLGYTCHAIEGDLQPRVFIVSRGAETRGFDNLDKIEHWLHDNEARKSTLVGAV